MRALPEEFDPNHVAAKATNTPHMYAQELATKDPMRSVLAANPEIYFVPPKRSSEWGPMGVQARVVLRHHHRRQAPLLAEQRPARGHQESRATALGHVELGLLQDRRRTEPRSGRSDSPARFGPS
ncbi:MAG: hypothetical protein CM15mP68_2410 [Pseudomonadota bacterium]|nr:MAG: hypothetical protein CM15mP68_2410 [Pseudomonadota bacterium]